MKKVLLFVLLTVICIFANAQNQNKYDSDFKYSLFSNVEVGVAGVYSYHLGETHHQNIGASLMLTKRIGDFWRLRGLAEVNGFKPNGFDRFGKGMFGISFDLLPFYLFVDEGVVYNPSSKSRFGLALDGGAGLQFKIGDVSSIYIEGAVDRTNNGELWQSNASAKLGYMANLGIIESDRIKKSVEDNVHSEYGNLIQENKLLKTEAQKIQEANNQLTLTLERATNLCDQLEKKLKECNADKKELEENCSNEFPEIYFEYASSYLTQIEEDKVAMIARYILQTNDEYTIDGYCSNNGDTYRNQKLSEDRARIVYWTIIGFGVSPKRLSMQGHGMTDKDVSLEQKVIVRRVK